MKYLLLQLKDYDGNFRLAERMALSRKVSTRVLKTEMKYFLLQLKDCMTETWYWLAGGMVHEYWLQPLSWGF